MTNHCVPSLILTTFVVWAMCRLMHTNCLRLSCLLLWLAELAHMSSSWPITGSGQLRRRHIVIRCSNTKYCDLNNSMFLSFSCQTAAANPPLPQAEDTLESWVTFCQIICPLVHLKFSVCYLKAPRHRWAGGGAQERQRRAWRFQSCHHRHWSHWWVQCGQVGELC